MKPSFPLAPPYVVVYRNTFTVTRAAELNFTFSADEHCQLFLNSARIIDGPERGDPSCWYCQHYSAVLKPGEYSLTSRVICFGKEFSSQAQTSIRHGFYIRDNSGLLSEKWLWQLAGGMEYVIPYPDWGAFPRFSAENCNWDILSGKGGEWLNVEYFSDDRILHEPVLPLMLHEPETKYKIQHEKNRTLIVFDDYVCVWPEFIFEGEGTVQIRWAETPYADEWWNPHKLKGHKGNRDGSFFVGNFNKLILPGNRSCRMVDYNWRAGRYCELIFTDSASLKSAEFYLSCYPYKLESQSQCSSADLTEVLKMSYRTLQMCSHETYMDCPYFEQLMYIGDVRIESLISYVITSDTRLAEKSLRTLAHSQQPDGALLCRYPSRYEYMIPSFSMIYILAVHDFALWNDKPEFVSELLPVCRRVIDYLCGYMKEDELLYLPGWNFIDWVAEWERGVPPGTDSGTNCTLNYLMVMTLKKAGELERHFGETELEQKYLKAAARIEQAVKQTYFNPERGLFAEDKQQTYFSEHAQIIAMLASPDSALANNLQHADLTPCGIYFSHYYLEACYQYGLEKLFFKRLEKWYALGKEGLKTMPEEFEGPRSDCHAWSSHILYHYYASILGLRPAAFGFKHVQFQPMTGPLEYVYGSMYNIEVEVRNGKKRLIHADQRVN